MLKKMLALKSFFKKHVIRNLSPSLRTDTFDPVLYWSSRADRHGVRSVLNLGHKKKDVEAVTSWQKAILFPVLTRELRGDEKITLDFGCGRGRFTAELARLTHGKVLGIDISTKLLSLAPRIADTDYILVKPGEYRACEGECRLLELSPIIFLSKPFP